MAIEELIGSLPKGWEYSTLGETCAKGGGFVQTGPFGSQLHASDYVPIGIPSIMPQNIGDNRIVLDGIARITLEDAERLSRYRVRPGDIVYSRRGDVERRALIRSEEDGWLCGTGCLRVRFGKGYVDPRYASYYLGDKRVREWIVRHAHGATMANLNTSILSDLPFAVPPADHQRAIGDVLGGLDDKIDVNQRMNKTLEAMARAIFNDWFVDFGPTRAKAKNQSPYLAPEIWGLFPGALDDRNIPKGWRIGELQEIVELNPKEVLPSGTVAPYLDMAALPTTGSIPEAPVDREFTSGMRFRNGDTLIARITPCLENGKTAFIQNLPDKTIGWGSTEFIVIRPMPPVPMPYGYILAREPGFRAKAIQSMTGTSGRQRARTEVLAQHAVAVPDKAIWNAFGSLVEPIFERIRVAGEEAQTLVHLRDTILPKLMNGEMRVEGAEKQIEDAL